MKYKNYQEVLQAENSLEAMKEYLKDKEMTLEQFAGTEEAMQARIEAARWRFTSPEPFLPPKEKLSKEEIKEKLRDPNLPSDEKNELLELLYEGIEVK